MDEVDAAAGVLDHRPGPAHVPAAGRVARPHRPLRPPLPGRRRWSSTPRRAGSPRRPSAARSRRPCYQAPPMPWGWDPAERRRLRDAPRDRVPARAAPRPRPRRRGRRAFARQRDPGPARDRADDRASSSSRVTELSKWSIGERQRLPDTSPMLRLGIAGCSSCSRCWLRRRASAAPQFNGPFPIPTANAKPTGITPGPDGALWFAEHDGATVGADLPGTARSPRPGVLAGGASPTASSPDPTASCGSPTRGGNGGRSRPDASGCARGSVHLRHSAGQHRSDRDRRRVLTVHCGSPTSATTWSGRSLSAGPSPASQPAAAAKPYGIATGPDGNLWYTLQGDKGRIGRMTPAGVATAAFQTPTPDSNPTGIVAGPDGALWFTERRRTGSAASRPTVRSPSSPWPGAIRPTSRSAPTATCGSSDSRTGRSGGSPRRATPTAVADAPATRARSSIAAGPDGELWFAETTAAKLGRITPARARTPSTVTDAGRLHGDVARVGAPCRTGDDLLLRVRPDDGLWQPRRGVGRSGHGGA